MPSIKTSIEIELHANEWSIREVVVVLLFIHPLRDCASLLLYALVCIRHERLTCLSRVRMPPILSSSLVRRNLVHMLCSRKIKRLGLYKCGVMGLFELSLLWNGLRIVATYIYICAQLGRLSVRRSPPVLPKTDFNYGISRVMWTKPIDLCHPRHKVVLIQFLGRPV